MERHHPAGLPGRGHCHPLFPGLEPDAGADQPLPVGARRAGGPDRRQSGGQAVHAAARHRCGRALYRQPLLGRPEASRQGQPRAGRTAPAAADFRQPDSPAGEIRPARGSGGARCLGPAATRVYVVSLLAAAYAGLVALVAAGVLGPAALVALATLPLGFRVSRAVASRSDGPGLNDALVGAARTHAAFTLLLAAGVLA